MASSVKYYRDDAALTILGNLTEQNSENTQTLADVSVRLSTLEDSSTISVMGSANSYAAGLVLAGDATHGSEFLRKDGTWQIPIDTTYTAGTGIGLSGSNVFSNTDLGSSQHIFKTIAVSGQDNIVADNNSDTLTIAAGSNVTLTTTAVSDTLTISSSTPRTGFNGVNFMDQFTTTGSGAKQYLLGDGGVIQKWNNNAEGNGSDDVLTRITDHQVIIAGGYNGAMLQSGNAFIRVRSAQDNHTITHYADSGGWSSDDRYKSRTTDVGDALSLISQVRVRDYLKHSSLRVEEGVEDTDLTGVPHCREVGVVAQELEQISGLEWLVTEHNGIGIESNVTCKYVNYISLNIYLLRAFQQLNELNTALTARVAALES